MRWEKPPSEPNGQKHVICVPWIQSHCGPLPQKPGDPRREGASASATRCDFCIGTGTMHGSKLKGQEIKPSLILSASTLQRTSRSMCAAFARRNGFSPHVSSIQYRPGDKKSSGFLKLSVKKEFASSIRRPPERHFRVTDMFRSAPSGTGSRVFGAWAFWASI